MSKANLMRRLRQTLFVLILIGLLIFVIYFAYRFVWPRWVQVVFYTYLGIGILMEIVGRLWIRNEMQKSRSVKDEFVSSYQKASPAPKLLTRLREKTALIAGVLAAVLVWPATLIAGFDLAFFLKRVRDETVQIKEYLVSQSLRLPDFHHSVFALIITLLTCAIGIARGSGLGYGRAFIIIMGASVVLRHIRYSVMTEGLPIGLRRLSTNPYLVFLLIAACDFLNLTLSFAILSADSVSSALNQQHLIATGISLYRFQELIRIVSGQTLSFTQIITGIAGLLFYLALLRVVMRFRDFRRDDDDYHWLASCQIMLGSFSNAYRFLDRVKSRTKITEGLTITALLGLNEIERAEQRARVYLDLDGMSPTFDLSFRVMLDICIKAPIPDSSVASLIQHGLKQGVSDSILQDSVLVLASNSPTLLEPFIQAVSPLEMKYPLTTASLLILANDNAQAIALLDQATPGSELEEITRLVMRLRATVTDPEKTDEEISDAFLHWFETTFPTVKELLPNLSDSLDKVMAFAQLAFLQKIATLLGEKQIEEQLTFILDQVKKQVSGQPGEFVIKAMEIRLDSIPSE